MDKIRGKVISVEGIDACGKGTNTEKMVKYIESKGKKVCKISYPQYDTTIGKVIARYLKGEFGDINQVPYELICIAYAADRASMQKKVEKMLEDGYYIIFDRYTYSNLFTAAKMPRNMWKEFISWVEEMEFGQLGLEKPDFNFYLYVDPKISIERIEQRGKREYQNGKEDIHENNSELLIKVAECYLDNARKNNNWFIIDQMKNGKQISFDEVFLMIKEKLDYVLELEKIQY